MKITSSGVWFDYCGDEVLWLWWWKRTTTSNGKKHKFYSLLANTVFVDIKEYWVFWGEYAQACRQDKVYGYTDDEIFVEWAATQFQHNITVILRNVNYELKPGYFWASITPRQRVELKKDVTVLFFNNMAEAKRVFESIRPEFAEAYWFRYGKLQAINNEISFKSGQVKRNNPVFER